MFDTIKTAFEGVWTSFVRTVIPLGVGAVVTFLTNIGLPVGEDFTLALGSLLGALAAALFYLIIRVAEKYRPQIGILLGSAKQPVYVAPAVQPEVEAIVSRVEAGQGNR